jgi:hypothetical protein
VATTAQTIEELDPTLRPAGLTLGSLERVTRMLKQSNDPDLLPKSKKGGGTGGIDLQPRHLVNLKLAFAAADTAAEAPAVVPVYRALIPVQVTVTATEDHGGGKVAARSETKRREMPGRTLLATADHLPVWDDPPDIDLGTFLENVLRRYDPRVEAEIKEFAVWRARPWAEITARTGPGVTETWAFGPAPDLLAPFSAPWIWTRPPGVCCSLPVEVFKILGRLARDGMRQDQRLSSDAAGGTAAEDTETTTPAAGGTGPASVVDASKASQPGGNPVISEVSTQQDSDANKKGQSSPPSASHGSPSSDFTDQPKDDPPWPSSSLSMPAAG